MRAKVVHESVASASFLLQGVHFAGETSYGVELGDEPIADFFLELRDGGSELGARGVEARLAALSDGFEREEHVVTPLLDRLERGGDVEVSGWGCGWCERRRVPNAPRLLGAPFASLAVHVLELAVHVLELVVLILVLIGLVLVGLLVLILSFGLLLFAVVLGAVSSLRIVAPRLVARLVYGEDKRSCVVASLWRLRSSGENELAVTEVVSLSRPARLAMTRVDRPVPRATRARK